MMLVEQFAARAATANGAGARRLTARLDFRKATSRARLRGRSAAPPVRRISALVAGQGGDARQPATERRIVHLHRHEARGQGRRLRFLQGAPEQLDAREVHLVYSGAAVT